MDARLVIDWNEETRERVRETSHLILCCWDDWEASAGQDAQGAQDTEAYFDAMYAQLDAVLMGLLDKQEAANNRARKNAT